MKTGRSLQDLAAELDRQATSKRDYLADTRRLEMKPLDSGKVMLDGVNGGMQLKLIAHAQLANSLQIPKTYYDRMLQEAPDLLSTNVNRWLAKQPAKKLIRTLDGEVRAILSDSYRPLDNLELAEAVLPKLIDLQAHVVSSEVTDSRLYIKAVTDRIAGEIKVGDVINAGVVVSNSEVGQGSLRVEVLDFRLVCANGMIREASIRKAHLGRSSRGQDVIEDSREFFRDETRQADDRAFFLKVRDATTAMFDQERFLKRIEAYKGASAVQAGPSGSEEEIVEVTAKRFGFSEAEKGGILRHLIRGGDLSVWGVANAVTRQAQDVEQYDRATELEALGGSIIELPRSAWRAVSN